MPGAQEADLLSLWEAGQVRHPIDRALLLCARARPDIEPERLAQLPLGVVNKSLLQLRSALFGEELEVQVDCEACGQKLEVPLILAQLLAQAPTFDQRDAVELRGFTFRVPQSDDLAAIVGVQDSTQAALQLLQRCCLKQAEVGPGLTEVLEQAQMQLESADPMADLRLDLNCAHCGAETSAALDIGALLWTEVQANARALLSQVHVLAMAYGWTEKEVLSLSPARRLAYLDLAGGSGLYSWGGSA